VPARGTRGVSLTTCPPTAFTETRTVAREADCRTRTTTSAHLHHGTDGIDRQGGERSIAEVADQLGVKADVVYYWAKRGYLPTRRGQGARRWVTLTPELQAACHARIAGSYKFPEDVKTAHHIEGIAV